MTMNNLWYDYTALQSQKPVAAYFKSKQLLPFGFTRLIKNHSHLRRIWTSQWTVKCHYLTVC